MNFRDAQNPGIGGLDEITDLEALTLQNISSLGDPNADRLLFWDDSAGSFQYLTTGSGLTITGTTIDVTAGGSGDMVLASAQTNSGTKTFLDGSLGLRNVANTFTSVFQNAATAPRTYTLKDASGTIAFTSDITGTNSGTNTGDQTSIVGITGTMAQFDTAVTDGNIVYQGQALGTPLSGTVTNLTGTASININGTVGATTPTTGSFTTVTTSGNIELGHATDTTLSRVSAGVIAVEGATIPTLTSTSTFSTGVKTFLAGMFALRNVANTFNALFTNTNTADRTYTLKDASGTLAFTTDITGTNSGTNTGDQTITNTSDATSHTVTLSASGGSIQLIEGSNITLTTGGTGSAGTVTIASTASGSGTVTNTGGNLTANAIVLGAGTVDTKVSTGITSDGVAQLNLGVNTTTIGKLKMFGNTSGDVTLQPTAAAGTATVQTLPATTGTLVNRVTTANGVSASNSDGALTVSLGDITPTKVSTTVGTNVTGYSLTDTSRTLEITPKSGGSNGIQLATTTSTNGALILSTNNTERIAISGTGPISVTSNLNVSAITSSYNIVPGFVSTVTAAGTTTLTVSSLHTQEFTGTTTQTITLPVVSTLTLGHSFRIINNSTGSLTVNSSGGNLVQTITAGSSALIICILITGTTAASWESIYTTTTSGDVTKVGTPVNNQLGIWTGDGTLEGDANLTYDGTSFNLATGKNFQIAGSTILLDSAGTTTLSNIDALDATTETTIEGAIDTLANLTSIQGRTITLADAGTNAIFGWDDVAGAYENLTQGEVRAVAGLATTDSPEFTAINLGHTSDTTIARVSAGVASIEGNNIVVNTSSPTLATITTTGNIELGNASDTTLSRSAAGVLAVEGVVVPTISSTNTLTNKRKQPRVYTAANNASLTPEIDTYDIFHLTAMSAATTINNHSTSTPADGELMEFRFLDNGTARALTWGSAYVAKAGVALPTTTVLSKNLTCLFEYNSNLSKWNLLASGQEA